MQINRLIVDGFKGGHFDIALSGRDLIKAANRAGKTTLSEALSFLFAGEVPGCKRDDLIDYAPEGKFEITVVMDTGLRISRWFKVKKGLKTEIDLTFDPDGVEDNYTERQQRLVTFDLTKFLTSDDAYRLKTCMDLMPSSGEDDIGDKMHLEIEAVGDKLAHATGVESEQVAIRKVQADLQGIKSRLPDSLMERCNALAGLVKDKWAKEARSNVTTKTKAVRALGTIARDDGVSGVNLEALAEQSRQAQINLDELQR